MDGFGYFLALMGFVAGAVALGQVMKLRQRINDLEEPIKQQKQISKLVNKAEVEELVINKKEK
ncbi:hypothetical protein A2791_01085 [Candidatus Saccharibacteria bacterium RIFCSPHIGHO2_01_FULL_46_30]|nr:MAG: hypothetical protein A2791_01085 [Candidatus Saccharibacteria bacterium RIFCSPHIGHO2_01_FULL_46_30]